SVEADIAEPSGPTMRALGAGDGSPGGRRFPVHRRGAVGEVVDRAPEVPGGERIQTDPASAELATAFHPTGVVREITGGFTPGCAGYRTGAALDSSVRLPPPLGGSRRRRSAGASLSRRRTLTDL